VLYKVIAAMSKYGEAALASITVGFPVPYVILSRADSLETRLASIALCAVYARRRPQPEDFATSGGK
jgi:phosphotransacetylase